LKILGLKELIGGSLDTVSGGFMRRQVWARVLIFTVIFAAGLAHAKDLNSRLGIGYTNNFGLDKDLPSLAMRYYPNADYGIMGSLGVDTTKDNSRFGFGAKIVKIIFREDNLNFYTGAGAAIVSQETSGKNSSGFDISGVAGAEFFLPGLENLGFSFEAGVGITSISNQTRFRTIGDSPLRAGIIFYF
jgi:hypothetical protein